MWGQVAWETLNLVTDLVRVTGESLCSHGDCGKQAVSGDEMKCLNCAVQYCSKQCFKRCALAFHENGVGSFDVLYHRNRDQAHRESCSQPKQQPFTAREIVGAQKDTMREVYLRTKIIRKTLIFITFAAIL